MVQNLNSFDNKIADLDTRIQNAYFDPIDEDSIRKIRSDIVSLLEEVVVYLKGEYFTLSPRQKSYVVRSLNALYWDWLNLALNCIRLSIADPSTFSHKKKYKNEIINLSDDKIINHIRQAKDYIDKK